MKILLVAIALLVSSCASAAWRTVRLNTASTNLTTDWQVALTLNRPIKKLFVDDRSTTEIAVNCFSGTATLPPVNDGGANDDNIYVAGTSGNNGWAIDSVDASTTCWWKSMSGTISSGIIVISVQW